ncbi:DUF4190 domain-containing protein [Streptomyces xanthophaeus]|uniref:DUF4190 domain-containing protein n=1 Tax=Streptomyces xanthophaeus TaxID=67385 RepID=A0A919GXS4_9ACTN|nr:DUF4190 domain-containing protein [Streptomyces xanthophaeus]WST20223.1 DUF4190 domain-containing protein [Streptomyces xanthophaeus]WST64792.1 DUF4190 domain-containing protein [Streptomyces xanthophaeus]GHI83093.1 hypothetical protein Sxan_04570 [Streptomyces xanthophaeus]
MTPLTDSRNPAHTPARTGARAGAQAQDPAPAQDQAQAPARTRDADAMAVTAFVLGLVGLLVMNLFLGPIALVLGALALRRHTTRPGRARLGMALGLADLVVLACLVTADGTWSWSLT